MRLIRFLYKLILCIALLISIILTLNVFGVEFINPYMFSHYEYKKTYPNIRYYEDIVPIKDGVAIVYRGKIGRLTGDNLRWTNIAYQNHKTFSDGSIAVAYVQGGNYLHILSNLWQKDILYPANIEKIRIKNGRVLVLLSSEKEDYLIMYDKNQNIVFSAKYREKVIDCDFNSSFAIAILKPRDSNELALSFVDNRGVFMSKVLTPNLQNTKRCYAIENYILLYNGKSLEVYDSKIQKRIKAFSFTTSPEYIIGNTDILFAENKVLVYNRLLRKFILKQIEDFDSICATSDKIVTSKGNEVRIYSLNLNKLKTLKVNSFGFVKAVINADMLYYIYNDRIEYYQERW